MTRKIPITDGIPRDPLDTESVSWNESLSKSESSGSEESSPWEKSSDVEDDEVGAIEKSSDVEDDEVGAIRSSDVEDDEVGAIEKSSDVEGDEVGAIEKRLDVEVGPKVGDDIKVVPETLATRREREMYRKFILLSGFWVVWVSAENLYFGRFDYSLNNSFFILSHYSSHRALNSTSF